ncbi:hypothetical protein T492DRAFT_837692 [Pavlovales sp. CCMP2436]|nr:hypothetical protein T492DRAFT_837692 [Pavlovales sp. CCMP2436]
MANFFHLILLLTIPVASTNTFMGTHYRVMDNSRHHAVVTDPYLCKLECRSNLQGILDALLAALLYLIMRIRLGELGRLNIELACAGGLAPSFRGALRCFKHCWPSGDWVQYACKFAPCRIDWSVSQFDSASLTFSFSRILRSSKGVVVTNAEAYHFSESRGNPSASTIKFPYDS